ncbi:unnamed protein product [Ambrosiozyma monospora]|uniref:Unnamed protein product n=1 Tax=Ambrosiozyma monospora TaxID=43982 RepID=A0ACB5T0A1_AMBMO|nr:unnamed protein product [Ambrosiozyma monospora]
MIGIKQVNHFIVSLVTFASVISGLTFSPTETYGLALSNDTVNHNFATLNFTEELKWQLDQTDATSDEVLSMEDGLYCISLTQLTPNGGSKPIHDCFNYKFLHIPISQEIKIEASDNFTVDSVALLSIPGSWGLHLNWVKTTEIPDPVKKEQPQATLQDGTDSPKTVKPPMAEPSFIQKYWMYIVPPLILFMLASGGAE